MRRRRIGSRGRGGFSLVYLAITLSVLLAFVACAIDIGYISWSRAQLQAAADAASLAMASELFDRDELRGSPDNSAELAAARAAATSVLGANTAGGVAIQSPDNVSNLAAGDLFAGYLANPSTSGDRINFLLNSTVPRAQAPPLLYLPTAITPTLPFITPPTPAPTTYNMLNAASVVARRDRGQNGSLGLFFGGVTGRSNIDVTATATATYEDRIVGFRTNRMNPVASKLLPLAMDVNTFAAIAAGNSSLDLWKYDPTVAVTAGSPSSAYASRVSLADPFAGALLNDPTSLLSILLDPTKYGFDLSKLYVAAPAAPALAAILPGDRIKEALLVPLAIPKQTFPPLSYSISVGNLAVLPIGQAAMNSQTELARQFREGVSQADLKSASPTGELRLGPDGTLVLPGNGFLDGTLKSALLSICGQPRIIPLYRPTADLRFPALLGSTLSFTIVGFAGVVVVDVVDIPPILPVPPILNPLTGGMLIPGLPAIPRSLKLFVQPEFVIDGTAIGGGDAITRVTGARTSCFVYRPLALAE